MRLSWIRSCSVTAIAVLAVVLGGATPSAAEAGHPAGYRLRDLGTLGGESSYASAINDRGHVVGSSQIADGSWHGFLWRSGRMRDLGLFRPTGVNNRDEIIGTFDFVTTAYLWRAGKLIELGSLGGPFTYPVAVNDRSQVAGTSSTDDGVDAAFRGTAHAAVYRPARLR